MYKTLYFLSLVCYLRIIHSQILNKDEGAECKTVLDEVWTCQSIKDCPQIGDFKRSRPEICGFQGKEPIICCPPNQGAENLDSGVRLPSSPTDKMSERDNESTMKVSETVGGVEPSIILVNGTDEIPPPPNRAPYALQKCIEYQIKLCVSNDAFPSQTSFIRKSDIIREPFVRPATSEPITRFVRDINNKGWKYDPVVVGGKPAKEKQFPFVAVIGFGEEDKIRWECGGTIISENWILSAAHCASTNSGNARWIGVSGMYIRTTSTIDDSGDGYDGAVFQIISTVLHPDYKPPAMYNDIALFKSQYTLGFSVYLRPACLHPLLVVPRNVTVAGWGTTEFGGSRSSSLLYVDLKTVDPTSCQKLYNGSRLLPRGYDAETMICAGETKSDACTGDSGGPLFFKSSLCLHTQVGVVSFGRNCGIYPGVYTRVSYYIPWIESIVWPPSQRKPLLLPSMMTAK